MSVGKRASGQRGNRASQDRTKEIQREANRHTSTISFTGACLDSAKGLSEFYDTIETYDPATKKVVEASVADKSVTAKQFLRILAPRPLRGIVLKGRQLDKTTGEMVEVSEIKILKMSDRSLLNRSQSGNTMPIFRRMASRSKRITIDADADLSRYERKSNADLIEIDLDEPVKVGRSKVSSKGVKL